MSGVIKLPSERVAQLRILSKNRDVPIADLVAEFVRSQIDAGNLSPDIPSLGVSRVDNAVVVDFGIFQRVLGTDLAKAYAAALRHLSRPKSAGYRGGAIELAMMAGEDITGLSRQGVSVRIVGANGAERTLARSIARDLADLIEQAAA